MDFLRVILIYILLLGQRCCPSCPRRPKPKCPPVEKTWQFDFRNGNQGVFMGGTDIVDNADGTISVFGTAHTWFNGRKLVWPRCGFYTAAELWLNPGDLEEGEFFTWSSSINNTEGDYLAEMFTNVRKLNGQLRVCSNNYGSSPQLNLNCAQSENAGVICKPGFYTVVTRYFERQGFLYSRAAVLDSKCNIIYQSRAYRLYHLSEGHWTPIPIGLAGGHGYGWFSQNAFLEGIKIKSIWIAERH